MGESRKQSICYFDVEGCAVYGKNKLETAIKEAGYQVEVLNHFTEKKDLDGFVLVVGSVEDQRVEVLLKSTGTKPVREPQSTIRKWCKTVDGNILLLSGSDQVGLMYTLLEMAEQVRTEGVDALINAEDQTEIPENEVRCMDRYLLGHLDNEWFLSEEFWRYYLERLAQARFNRFCLILGFDTAYMSPPYPFFTEVEEFPQIRMKEFGSEQREQNLNMLRKIISLCHEYGIQFVLATWQQRPWTTEQDELVSGLPEDENMLSEYCYCGMKALLKAVPDIDIVQFRVNHESGVGTQVSAEAFWNHCADAVADAGNELGKTFTLDLRAKGLTETMVRHAFARGLKVEVPTKYWCEHAALPYHLSTMRSEELAQLDNFNHSRRYSYADMLKKPRYYNVIFRLWNYGSTNLFLWGDADYARRFSKSCSLSQAAGFQVNAPLSLKYGHELSHKEAWNTFADESLRSGKWEDERFWMWYTMFGRLGYRTDTHEKVWLREFDSHFGKGRGKILEQALAEASKIIPMITTVHMPVHPSLRYWTEMSTGFALFDENNLYSPQKYDFQSGITYGSTEPSDHGMFYGIEEYVNDCVNGTMAGKYTPVQYAGWLQTLADGVEEKISQAQAVPEKGDNAEYKALLVDLRMLCDMARYHAYKIRAALELAWWKHNKDTAHLKACETLFRRALRYWELLSEKGDKAYYHDLDFSSAGSKTRRGTWRDLKKELEADLNTIEKLLDGASVTDTLYKKEKEEKELCLSSEFPAEVKAGSDIRIRVSKTGVGIWPDTPVLHYRHVNQTEGLFHTLVMTETGEGYEAVIPGEYVTADWDLMVYITVQKRNGICSMYPGIYNPVYPYPYHVITVND